MLEAWQDGYLQGLRKALENLERRIRKLLYPRRTKAFQKPRLGQTGFSSVCLEGTAAGKDDENDGGPRNEDESEGNKAGDEVQIDTHWCCMRTHKT